MHIRERRELSMEKGSAKKMVKLLDKVLKIQANSTSSTSCILAYEPKTPAALDRYKKIK